MALQMLPVRVGVRFLRLAYAGVSRTKRVVGGTLYAAHASEGYTHISTELISLSAVNTAARQCLVRTLARYQGCSCGHRRRRRRRGSGSLSRSGSGSLSRSGSGSRRSGLRLAGSADADETATALRVPRAVL